MSQKFTSILFSLLLFTGATGTVLGADREQDIQSYISVFTSNSLREQLHACQRLQWEGLDDERIFDRIEQILLKRLENYDPETSEVANFGSDLGYMGEVGFLGWLTRALATSGSDKYKASISKVSAQSKSMSLSRQARSIKKLVDKYKKWNPIISEGDGGLPGESGKESRYINMIRSNDPELAIIGAKRIFHEKKFSSKVLNAIDEEVMKNYKTAFGRKHIDALGWMVKSLAVSGIKEYKNTLSEVAIHAKSQKLRGYGKKSLAGTR